MEYRFRDLNIGDTFDFINDSQPYTTTFYTRCMKLTPRKYASLDMSNEYRVGSVYATVYHVERVGERTR